ncbi:MAG: DUF262 domain-containing HNH endonuclease family protein [Desulfurococcales archaeon]|nr:DUF262 domain-containing HNH endonuclease family protein [Desulfurococcales archaeon]
MSELDSPIKAEHITLGELFTRFMFVVPKFQRPFSWTAENFEKLFTDIYDAMKDGQEAYFLGSMVFWLDKEHEGNIYQVIDGQQRLASLTILFATLRDRINNEGDKNELQTLIFEEGKRLLGIPSKERLTVWDNLQEYFKKYVYSKDGTRKFLEDLKNNRIKLSSKNDPLYHLKEAIETYHRLIDNYITNEKELVNFAGYILNKVYVVSIRTNSLGSAIRLFNVLNTRGLPLSPVDIIKAMNLEDIRGVEERERYADKWIEIELDIGREELENLLSFIRFIYAKEKAKKSLSEEYDKLYKERVIPRGIEFIKILEEYSDIYKEKILNKSIKIDNIKSIEKLSRYPVLIDMLRTYYPVKEWIAVLLYFYKQFPNDYDYLEFFEKLERKLVIDWLADLTNTEIITRLSWILKLIEEAENPREVLSKMYSYTPPGTRIKGRVINYEDKNEVTKIIENSLDRRDFARWRGGKLAKYVLLRIDLELHSLEEQRPEYNLSNITLEHILPRSPSPNSEWVRKFDELTRYEWTDRLGNLVLISSRKNTKASNYDFRRKKEEYLSRAAKTLAITQEVLKYEDWTLEILGQRQKTLIERVKKIYLIKKEHS